MYFLLNLKDNRQKAKMLLVSILAPFLLAAPYFLPAVAENGISSISFPFWFDIGSIYDIFGYLPTFLFIVGVYFFSRKRKEELSIVLSSMALIVTIFVFINTGTAWLIPYQRAFIPLFLLMGIIAAHTAAKIRPMFLLFAVLAIIVAFSAYQHTSVQYYHLIDDTDYDNFLWIRENTPEDAIAMLDPWKARPFPAVAERQAYAVMPFGPVPNQTDVQTAFQFLDAQCSDTDLLIKNNISVVYSPAGCHNKDLINVYGNVYLLSENS